jgi:DNA repair exonuclease SbcCD ATPase subunit
VRVSRIELSGVTTHTDTDLAIPPTGVVLVSGDNGSGKSSLLEALPMVLWGKTLRGTRVWAPDTIRQGRREPTCTIAVTVDGVRYTRNQRGATSSLGWPGCPVYESTKHALSALTKVVGSFDAWRQSCVLSAADAANFTQASDTDRKRLVERLAGLTRYEQANDILKDQLRAARQAASHAQTDAGHAALRVQAAHRRLDSCQAASLPAEPVPPTPPDHVDVTDQLTKAERLVNAIQSEVKVARQAERDLADHLAIAKSRHQAHQHDQCGSCGQAIPHDHREASRLELQRVQVEASRLAGVTAGKLERLTQAIQGRDWLLQCQRRAGQAAQQYMNAHASYQRELAAYQRTKQLAGQLDAQRRAALDELGEATTAKATADLAFIDAQSTVVHLEAAVKVTGPQGIRAAQLADTLGALEAASNMWLARLDTDIRLEIRAFGEKADGSPTARVSQGVRGAGGGHGYSAASGGERRRIDVAVMLGLSQIADAARGGHPATLWADEVFDALDAQGRDSVAGLLADLASSRAVVVVSHTAQEEVGRVACVHYHVTGGKVTTL